jgi:small GTP-binding protein
MSLDKIEKFHTYNKEINDNEFLFKVLVVGDIGAGKTSFIKRYVHGMYSPHYKSTIGVDFALKVVQWDNDTNVRLQLWDIAGQERFGSMTRVYYKEATAALIVFDVTRGVVGLDNVKKWKADIDAKVTFDNNPIPVILLANKYDLIEEEDEWDKLKGIIDTFCTRHDFVAWFETSAKDGLNIELAGNNLVKAIMENVDIKRPIHDTSITGNIINITDNNIDKHDGCYC